MCTHPSVQILIGTHTHTHTHMHTHNMYGTRTLRKELNLLSELLLAQQHISQWQFFPAVLSIQACETRLSGWHGVLPLDMVSHLTLVRPLLASHLIMWVCMVGIMLFLL